MRGSLGLRVAAWYAAVFVTSTIALVWLTYALLSSSLAQRDREIITSTLREYASRYEAGGLPALASAVELGVRTGRYERLFVRVLGPRQNALFLSEPPEWGEFDVDELSSRGAARDRDWAEARARDRAAVLEVSSLQLWDGTIIQVGKSTESRDALLAQFRTVVALISILIMVVGVSGGIVLTRSTLRPIRDLIHVVRGIIQTGRTEARVPVSVTADAVDELSGLFNVMLDRITTLMSAMRDSLDNVAHDLRTPMARLRGLAERALQSGNPEAQREALADCLEESDRVLAMLNTLMDISEAETGTLRLTRDEVSLPALIAEVVELYEDVAEEKGITVKADAGAGPRAASAEDGDASPNPAANATNAANAAATPLVVTGDRDRLRQALANLLDNAIKYTPSGGQVEIAGARRSHPDGDHVVITFRDTGIGIAPEEQPRIWDRLYRGDRSRAERGLGLGLSLVKAYVHAHGGTVGVDSQSGRGSTFTIVLPARPSARPLPA